MKNKVLLLVFCMCVSLSAKSNMLNQEIEYTGETVTIPVSMEQPNRIVLPTKITSKVFSKEKNLEIAINENQAFVKFSPIIETTKLQMEAEKEAKPQKQEIHYQKSDPTALYLLTEDDVTYSFILVPSQMDAQTIIVNNNKKKKKELSYKENQLPFRNVLDNLTKTIFSGKEPTGYEIEKRNDDIASSSKINIVLTEVFRGAKLDVFKYKLINKSSTGASVEERDLIPLLDKSIYRISIYFDNEVYEIATNGYEEAIIVVASDEDKQWSFLKTSQTVMTENKYLNY